MQKSLSRFSWLVALRGVLGILFGMLAIALPGATLGGLVLAFGVYVILDGACVLGSALDQWREDAGWGVPAFEGTLGLALGAIIIAAPDRSATVIWFLLAGWAILTGALELAAAYVLELVHGRRLIAATGVVSMLLGAAMLLWPAATALAIAWFIGLYAVVFGGLLVALALSLHRIAAGTLHIEEIRG